MIIGCLVCNPPYGERLGTEVEAQGLYRELGGIFRVLPTWSLFALSASGDFERHFGARSSKNRKLYNGNIRCWLYQYFGPPRLGSEGWVHGWGGRGHGGSRPPPAWRLYSEKPAF